MRLQAGFRAEMIGTACPLYHSAAPAFVAIMFALGVRRDGGTVRLGPQKSL